MIIVGLLLLILAAAIIIVMVMAGGNTVNIGWDALNLNWSPTALVVFLLGAVTLLLLVVAFGALRAGTRRKVAKGQELRRLRKLEAERAATPATTPPPPQHGAPPADPRPTDTSSPYGPSDGKLD